MKDFENSHEVLVTNILYLYNFENETAVRNVTTSCKKCKKYYNLTFDDTFEMHCCAIC